MQVVIRELQAVQLQREQEQTAAEPQELPESAMSPEVPLKMAAQLELLPETASPLPAERMHLVQMPLEPSLPMR